VTPDPALSESLRGDSKGPGARARVGVFVATFGYLGYVPAAPGTCGSLAGLAVFVAVRATGSTAAEILTIIALFAIGIWSGTIAEGYFGRVDPPPVVLDEVIGMLITLALLPVTATGALLGFVVFRVLDVVKPWPSGRFEALPGGLGVMADDGMAGLYGNLAMRGLIAVAPSGWLA
jgi:phosphatidylglycerophosphatase A